LSFCILFTICLCIGVVLRIRTPNEDSETELSEVTEPSPPSYPYQPLMTVPGHSVMMMSTPEGQTMLVNTQPMVMMTQTGEPVVVQVALPSYT
jgi:hypothetical protein